MSCDKRESLRQILVEAQRRRDCARYLDDFDRVGQPVAEMIVEARREDLSLVFQAPEGASVDYPVAITLKLVPIGMRELRISPALRLFDGKPKVGQRGPAHDQDSYRAGDLAERE